MKELYSSDQGIGFKKFFALYEEYIPSFEDMEQVLTEPKSVIWKKYSEIMNKKVPIKDNSLLREILLYKPSVLKDVVFGILAIFFIKPLKLKVKNFARRDFYKLLSYYSDV